MAVVFINVILPRQFISFSATFFPHNLSENKRGWDCSFYTVTVTLDLKNFSNNTPQYDAIRFYRH